MSRASDLIIYILLFGVIPLVYCILSFIMIVKLLSKTEAVSLIMYANLSCGVGFLVFQLISLVPLDVGNFIDRLEFSLDYSWMGVLNYILVDTRLEDWFPEDYWVIEAIYIFSYMLIGLTTAGGLKLWKIQTQIRYVGLSILILCFSVYSFGLFFWMVTGLYL